MDEKRKEEDVLKLTADEIDELVFEEQLASGEYDEEVEQFIQRVRRYTTLTELTPYALRELVKAVYVEAPDKSSGKRKQKVHIEYDLVGYIPVDELIKAEQV